MKGQSTRSLRLVVLVSLSCVVLPAPPAARASLISPTGGGAVCGRTGAPVCTCGGPQGLPRGEAPGLHGLEALGGVELAGTLAAGPAGPSGAGAVFQVNLVSGPNRFVPEELTIQVGDTVEWVWLSGNHSTTSRDGVWDSGVLLPAGSRFSFTFNDPGDFAYFCIPHDDQGMVGVIHVLPAGAIPEPSGLLLLGIGTAALAGYCWRVRKRKALGAPVVGTPAGTVG